jgi:hypothetical protein
MPRLIPLLLFASLASAGVLAEGRLENPANGAVKSGIHIFSGWYCDADKIELVVDDRPPKEAAYGTSRRDTEAECGDIDNGFALLWSYNLFGPGEHTVVALADGVEFARATFTVEPVGDRFMKKNEVPETTTLILADHDKEVTIGWDEATQNFAVLEVEDTEFPMSAMLDFVAGNWAGSWQGVGNKKQGEIAFTFETTKKGRLQLIPVMVSVTGTGCQESTTDADPVDLNALSTTARMEDGSALELRMEISEGLNAIAGVLHFDKGPCSDLDGVFFLGKKQ